MVLGVDTGSACRMDIGIDHVGTCNWLRTGIRESSGMELLSLGLWLLCRLECPRYSVL